MPPSTPTSRRSCATATARRRGSRAARAACRSRWRSPTSSAFPHEGTLHFLDNQLDPATGTIRGRAVFRNPDHRLTPGLFVRLRLPGTAAYRGVLVEDRAVGTDLDRRFVLVVGGDKRSSRGPSRSGRSSTGCASSARGSSAGELVVVNGLQRVRPGVQVNATVASSGATTGGAQ